MKRCICLIRGINFSGKNKVPMAELERVQACGRAVFRSFDRAAYQKTNWWSRTAAPGIGEHLTIRTAGTVRKLAAVGDE